MLRARLPSGAHSTVLRAPNGCAFRVGRSHLSVAARFADPAPDERIDALRSFVQEYLSELLHARQQIRIPHQIGNAQLQQPGLASTQHFAGTAQLEW